MACGLGWKVGGTGEKDRFDLSRELLRPAHLRSGAGRFALPLHYASPMGPEAPPTVPRSVSDEERDCRIIREHRETLTAELSALIEEQGQAWALLRHEEGEGSSSAGKPQ